MDKIKFSKISIISSNSKLCELISSHFRRQEEYLPVFDMIDGSLPSHNSIMYGEFTNECKKIANSIKLLNSQKIILVGCQNEILKQLEQQFPRKLLLIVDSYDLDLISNLPGFRSKRNNVSIHEKKSEPLQKENIIAIEYKENDLSTVIAKNLAISENALIVKLPVTEYDEVIIIRDLFRDWMNSKDSIERNTLKQAILDKIMNKLEPYNFSSAKTITFVTRGIPYGFYPFKCSTTHFFSHKLLGFQIILGMLKRNINFLKCTSVYICDPHKFDHSESEKISDIFAYKSFVVKEAFGSSATARDVINSTQYLPIDFIYYTTHCGETKGRRIRDRFITPDGNEHYVCFDLVVTFAPKPNSKDVQVIEYQRWVSLDGVDWKDKIGKKKINASFLIEEYLKQYKNRTPEEIKANRIEDIDIGIVKGSDALMMDDFAFVPMFHQVGGKRHPLIFNNTCSSWREFAVRYAIAGSSNYIGTSVDIPNPVAIDTAINFSESIVKGRTVGFSLYNAQKNYIENNGYTPYLLFGYIFSKYNPVLPRKNIPEKFVNNLKSELISWKNYSKKASMPELKRNSTEIVDYLQSQVTNYLLKRKKT